MSEDIISCRESALASRHRALGSDLEDWNGMGTAWAYHTNPEDEHDAVREAAGLFDMSPLKKVYIRGADAMDVANQMITRDATRLACGRSTYASVLTDEGKVCDDAILYRNSDTQWLFVHGSGNSMSLLQDSAKGLNVDIELDDDLHNISLQGPAALQLLNAHTPIDLAAVQYFHHMETELFGYPCRVSRTGYSGERGYELFVNSRFVCDLWDQILGHGEAMGVMPCSFTALDKVRVEAALLFYGYDMTDEHYPWEVGLGFTIDRNSLFRGRENLLQKEGQERFLAAGIVIEHGEALAGGEQLLLDGQPVGVVNSPAYSHRLQQSLALVHLQPAAAIPGTQLAVAGHGFEGQARVVQTPFLDPQKSRVRAA